MVVERYLSFIIPIWLVESIQTFVVMDCLFFNNLVFLYVDGAGMGSKIPDGDGGIKNIPPGYRTETTMGLLNTGGGKDGSKVLPDLNPFHCHS